jgi:hypothetical protein
MTYRPVFVLTSWRRFILALSVAGLVLAASWTSGPSRPPAFAVVPCSGPCMRVGSASATVGGFPVSVDITLEGVPPPGQTGYQFDLVYDDTALTRWATSTSTCIDGELYHLPLATGPSPYSALCENLPHPGTPHADCSPAPCTLATVSFQCQTLGTFSLNLDDTTSAYADPVTGVPVPNLDGVIACGPAVGTPVPTVIPTATPTPVPPVSCSGTCIASSSGAGVVGGPPVPISVILENVPLPGEDGYAFDLYYNDTALTRLPGTTVLCIDGMSGIFPAVPGPSPYFVGCGQVPFPGTLHKDCSPGPCLIATILFQCNSTGTFALDIDDTSSEYAAGSTVPILVPNIDGVVTCALSPTATPVPPTATPTAASALSAVGGVTDLRFGGADSAPLSAHAGSSSSACVRRGGCHGSSQPGGGECVVGTPALAAIAAPRAIFPLTSDERVDIAASRQAHHHHAALLDAPVRVATATI